MSDSKLVLKTDCDYVIPITFDVAGELIDLTGATVYFAIKKSPVDIDDNSIFKTEQSSHSDQITNRGETTISIPASALTKPGKYIYAFAYTTFSGSSSETVTGECIIEQKINRRS